MASVPVFEQKKVVSLFVVLGWLGLAALGLYLLYRLGPLIPPALVASMIALTLTPEVDRLERQGLWGHRFPRGAAIGIIYVLFLSLFALLVKGLSLVSIQMTDLIQQHFGRYLRATPAQVVTLTSDWMQAHHFPEALRNPVLAQAKHVPELLTQGMAWFGSNLPGLAGNLVWVIIVPIIAFFLLLDFNKILGKGLLLVPQVRREGLLTVVTEVIAVFGGYVRGVLTVTALDMAVIFVVLWVAGLRDYALSVALTAGLLYTVPYFGALAATVLIGLVTLATLGLVPAVIVVLVMIFIQQIVFDTILAPRIIGGSVHLHPLLTLFALMGGYTLFGIGGTLLAVPLVAAFQVILVHLFPQFKTDVVAVRRAATVVQKTVAKESEEVRPELRQSENLDTLKQEQTDARLDAEATQVLPAPTESEARQEARPA